MAPVINGRVIFNEVPHGFPIPGKTIVHDESKTIDVEAVPLAGGFVVKTLYLSIDPYMRGRMRAPGGNASYSAPFTLGEPLTGYGVGLVVRSESAAVKVGDHVYGGFKHRHYNIYKDLSSGGLIIIHNKENIPWSYYTGILGMAGQTAYAAWKEYSRAKRGETAFVSGGAGPVGSLVIQLAKRDGLKVIASAGSEDKVRFMKEAGADVAFNYKTTDTLKTLIENGPIDVYWDNVGGETLEAALEAANIGARFIECGMISGYNNESHPIKNLMLVVRKSITMQGFIITRIERKYEKEFYETIPPLVASGELKYLEDVFEGLQAVGDALLAQQKGSNTGKAVVRVSGD